MQGPSRRQVCAGTALAGVSWVVGACAPAGDQAFPGTDEPQPPSGRRAGSLSDFRGIIGSSVSVEVGGSPRSLLLTTVLDHGAPIRKPRPRGEAFTLIMVADPGGPAIEQATYPARHPALGPFAVFLVPHLAPGRQPRYSATFSRI
jgi:hypothetical protein